MTEAALIKRASAKLAKTDFFTMSKRELHDTIQQILADLQPPVKETRKAKAA